MAGVRQGYGYMIDTSQAGSRYSGNDQCHGYGIYDWGIGHSTIIRVKIINVCF